MHTLLLQKGINPDSDQYLPGSNLEILGAVKRSSFSWTFMVLVLDGKKQTFWVSSTPLKKRKKKEEKEDRIMGDDFEVTFCIYFINSSVYG